MNMNAERFARIKEIFLEASKLDKQSQEDFLEEQCGTDIDLRKEVLSLLSHHSSSTVIMSDADTDANVLNEIDSDSGSEWIGKKLGKYEIQSLLGAGGAGVVLKAFDAMLQRTVAIKVLHSAMANDQAMFSRFLAEARAVAMLSHPNIVVIHEVAHENVEGHSEQVHYLVMEYISGGSAHDHIEKRGEYSVMRATEIAADACRGLIAAHAQALVHRDIKPANLLETHDNCTKITDFGIAKQSSEQSLHLTQTGQIIGSPYFMSPEQCEASAIDYRSDIYSLGATYFSLLTGKNPYSETTGLVSLINAHCHAPPPNPRKFNSTIPEACKRIVEKAMATLPKDRYQTAQEMLADIEEVKRSLSGSNIQLPSHLNVPSKQFNQRLQVGTPRIKNKLLAMLVPLLLLCAGFFGWQTWQNNNASKDDPSQIVPAVLDKPVTINFAHSSEKKDWLDWAVQEFAKTAAGKRIKVHLMSLGSNQSAQMVIDGPGEVPIHVWSPSSNIYQDRFVHDWITKHGTNSPLNDGTKLVLTPLVIVVWKERLDALERKYGKFDYRLVLNALKAEKGWETIADHPDWGNFNLGWANPEKTNSGLLTTIVLAYSFHGKHLGLTVEDIQDEEFQRVFRDFVERVISLRGKLKESTRSVMEEMIFEGPGRYDCAIVYENLAIASFENAAGRWGELRVVYPQYNLWNDNPYYVLDVPWSSVKIQKAADTFRNFLMSDPVQHKAVEFGYRPGNVAISSNFPGSPFVTNAHLGIKNPAFQFCEPPSREVVAELLDSFAKFEAEIE